MDLKSSLTLHVNFGMLEEETECMAYLRGAFLAGGSVTDPTKRYHLEMTTSHYKVSRETCALLIECGFSPKELTRGGNNILYFKQSDYIEDFLTAIGAQVSAMGVMEAKVEKDLRNGVNRRVNCETANLTKVVDALSLIHISEPTRQAEISYAVFCLKKKKKKKKKTKK